MEKKYFILIRVQVLEVLFTANHLLIFFMRSLSSFRKELTNNFIKEFSVNPDDLGIKLNKFENILGKEAEYNAEKIKEIFKGTDNEFSVAVSLNAAAGLIVSEKVSNFNQAYKLARNQILSGKVYEHLIKITKF